MKVLQILPELNAGGVERTTLEIAEVLTAHGHVPHVCAYGGRMQPAFEALGTRLHLFNIGSKNPLGFIKNKRRLIDIIRSENIDVVHARSRAPAWPSFAAARATGRPFVTTYHGIYNANSFLKKRYNAIMARGDLIIANSSFTKRHIEAEHDTPASRIRVIPRGVDMKYFDPENISRDAIQQQKRDWEIGDNQRAILLPGRLTRWKGQLIAVKAMQTLPKNCILVLMGDPQGRQAYVKEIKTLARELGVDDRIRVPGHSEDVPTALMAADIVIAPSTDPEAFGRTVTEAQAMGRPVVAAAHGGPMETIVEGKTGTLVPPSNAEALSMAINKLLNGHKIVPEFSRQHVEDHFSKTQLQSKTMAVYRELLM